LARSPFQSSGPSVGTKNRLTALLRQEPDPAEKRPKLLDLIVIQGIGREVHYLVARATRLIEFSDEDAPVHIPAESILQILIGKQHLVLTKRQVLGTINVSVGIKELGDALSIEGPVDRNAQPTFNFADE